MAEITPAVIRSIVTDDEFGGFRVTIPPRERNSCFAGCLIAAIAVVMGLTFLYRIADSDHHSTSNLVFLAVLGLIELALVVIVVIARTGSEILIIEGKTLVVRIESAGSKFDTIFELAEVANLRPGRTPTELGPGGVAFDRGGRTHYFGVGLSEYEALRLVKTIRSRFSIRDKDDWTDAEPLPIIT